MNYVIGLTGGIATGKSTVSQMLQKLGFIIIDADRIGHELLAQGTAVNEEIVRMFGSEFLDKDDSISRKKLGEYVFSAPQALARLNRIMHPKIILRIRELLRTTEGIVVIDAALLIECGMQSLCDEIWVVTAPCEEQIRRIMRRNRLGREDALRRVDAQTSDGLRRKYATHIIENSFGLDTLNQTVAALAEKARQKWERNRRQS